MKLKIRRFMAVTMTLAMGVGTLAGCGGSSSSSSSSQSADSSSATETPAPAAESSAAVAETATTVTEEPVVFTILSSAQTEQNADFELDMANSFMAANPNVTIEFIPAASNDIPQKFVQLSTADQTPDAVITTQDLIMLADGMGLLIDHHDVLSQEYIDSMIDAAYNESLVDGRMLQIPWFAVPTGLIYRSDWLEEIGMDTIDTMEDLTKVAELFTTGDRWGFSMVGMNNGSGTSRFAPYARAYGVDDAYLDADGNWVSDYTTDKFRNALQDFVNLDLVSGAVPPGAAEAGYPEASNYFAQEKTGLMITGSNAIGVIVETNPELEGKIGCVPVPKEERYISSVNPMGYSITTACENPELLAEYLLFMANAENAATFAALSGRLPTTIPAMAEIDDPALLGFIDAMEYAYTPPTFPGISELYNIAGEAYNSMLGGGVSIDEAMARVESKVEALLAEHNG